jgi:hypothetical protein
MPCTISGTSIRVDSTGAVVAWTGAARYVYLKPSRDDFLFNRAAGGTYIPWTGDSELIDTEYEGGIRAAVNASTGGWSFSVPFSDTEIQLVGATGPGTPALQWNILDPNVSTGLKVYYGPTLSATVSTSKTMQELLALSSPNTWQIASSSYILYPYGTERIGSVSFAAGVASASVSFADVGTTGWRFTCGLETDDSGVTGVVIDSASKSSTGATLSLSAAPAAGKSATVHMWVRP